MKKGVLRRGKGVLYIGLDKVESLDVFDGVEVGNDHVPVTVIQMDYVVSLVDATQQISVGLHGALVVDMISDVFGLNGNRRTQGPFHF